MKSLKNNNVINILIVTNILLLISFIILSIVFYNYQKRINIINRTIENITETITETTINTLINKYLNKNEQNM